MMFEEGSQIVKNFVYLIDNEARTFEDVPDLFNLREVVGHVLEKNKRVI